MDSCSLLGRALILKRSLNLHLQWCKTKCLKLHKLLSNQIEIRL